MKAAAILALILPALLFAALIVVDAPPASAGSSGAIPPPMPATVSGGWISFLFPQTLYSSAGAPSGAVESCAWYDTLTKSPTFKTALGNLAPPMVLYQSTADSADLTNPVTDTDFSQTVSIPAASVVAGRGFAVSAGFAYDVDNAITPPIFQFSVRLASDTTTVTVASTPTLGITGLAGATLTNQAGKVTSDFTVRTVGASGSMVGDVSTQLVTTGGILSAVSTGLSPATAPTVDWTKAQTLSICVRVLVGDPTIKVRLRRLRVVAY